MASARLPEVLAPDVQALPFGPVRADVLESAEFTFLYIGEQILHYQPHLFFKHRGMEARFQGADVGAWHHPRRARVRCRQRRPCVGLLPGGRSMPPMHGAAARVAGCGCCWRNWSGCTTICTTWDISPTPRR